MPSRGRNFYSLLRLELTSRSPLRLGSNIVAFHPAGPGFIPDIILIYALFLIVKLISSIILISFILYVYITSKLVALAQMVAYLPLVRQVRGSIPGGVVNFHGDVNLAAPLVLFEKSRQWPGTRFHLLPSFHHSTQHNNCTTQTATHTVTLISTFYNTLYR